MWERTGMIQNSKIIGLTGGIASGKSTVSHYLKKLGFPIIDADRITHELYEKNEEFCKALVENFGEKIIQKGAISRKIIGDIVFSNQSQLKKLEEITHPFIFDKIKDEIEELKNRGEKVIFLDIALLFEITEKYRRELNLDKIWLVYTTEELQIERLKKRNQLSEEECIKRIKSQMPLDKKIELSDIVLYNTKNVDSLQDQIDDELRNEGIL